jgi:hypothetical protein
MIFQRGVTVPLLIDDQFKWNVIEDSLGNGGAVLAAELVLPARQEMFETKLEVLVPRDQVVLRRKFLAIAAIGAAQEELGIFGGGLRSARQDECDP